jgi:hypothetical protein
MIIVVDMLGFNLLSLVAMKARMRRVLEERVLANENGA